MNPQPPPSKLYADYVFDDKKTALQFWGPIPKNIKESINLSTPLIADYPKLQPLFSQERLHSLHRIIKTIHQQYNMLTPQVKENLERLKEKGAVIEAGHQPALLGGPGFVINKIAAITTIASMQNTAPVMFVGDHDHEQKELTVAHLPSPGPRGLTFSFPVPREFRMSPMHVIPIPPKQWLNNVVSKITSTYHELVAGSAKQKRGLYDTRTERIQNLLESTYDQSQTISEWTTRIWMRIVNMGSDSGVLFQQFSNPKIRELMLPAYEYLLASPNRETLIQALNGSAEKLEQLGYEPGIGRRTDEYVPFHLECPAKGCNRTRLDPVFHLNASETQITVSAQCPKCKTAHTLEGKATAPDLTEWAAYLSPRVDTRAFLVQSYTPVIVHIGGAGETSYHAQVSPALKANNSISPIFFRYSRLYYENPWTNQTAQRLAQEELTPLNYEELQRLRSAINTGYKEENTGVVQSLFAASQEHIIDTFEALVDAETLVEKERTTIINQQREITDPSQRKASQNHIGILTRRRQVLQTYLSQMFGRFSAERLGQEVSYIWIDAAMSMDPDLHFNRLQSHYHNYTPSAATFYLMDESVQF
jgi:uncharacterized protein YllA (UPF0747 family)